MVTASEEKSQVVRPLSPQGFADSADKSMPNAILAPLWQCKRAGGSLGPSPGKQWKPQGLCAWSAVPLEAGICSPHSPPEPKWQPLLAKAEALGYTELG